MLNGVMVRNRIIASGCSPHFVQGDQNYPGEGLITHFANKARDGAGIVVCKHRDPVAMEDKSHTNHIDIYHGPTQHYMCQMSDAVHYYGAKAMLFLFPPNGDTIPGTKYAEYDCSSGIPTPMVVGDGSVARIGKEAPEWVMDAVIEEHVQEAILAKEMGFDGCFIPAPYRMGFIGRFLSPLTNIRTDKYGGSWENRARFPLKLCKAIKDACGENFLIEMSISGDEHEYEGGKTIEESIYFANAAEGIIDILQIRGGQIDSSNAIAIQRIDMPHLELCAAIK
jgi:2,4-dienoyl-CoA reductase-like NADH-dependent reductase (Old Yellow Enzyme family)